MKMILMKVTQIDHIATGKQFRLAREELSLTIKELAERVELAPQYVADLEAGRRNWRQELADQFTGALAGLDLKGNPIKERAA